MIKYWVVIVEYSNRATTGKRERERKRERLVPSFYRVHDVEYQSATVEFPKHIY